MFAGSEERKEFYHIKPTKRMNEDILSKYNYAVPRYTSYPPANHFSSYNEEAYKEAILRSNTLPERNLSFYFHIPYCRHLCHYCGCNSYAMPDREWIDKYVATLHKEIDLLLPLLDRDKRISQIHYGGGSPTALPYTVLKELNEHLLSHFSTIDTPEIAIECHPAYLTEQDWEGLTESYFNRFSIGVQDLNPVVLKAVNRRPSALPLEQIFSLLRTKGVSINVDLLYGLPHQTVESFLNTVERIVALRPDRLVTFAYAHVPWVNKQQLVLEKIGLPTGAERNGIFHTAKERLQVAGYMPIGMDHFVTPEDELYLALQNNQLHRNFQGYCTKRTTAQVYALGVTGISQLQDAYIQHTKDIATYIESVEAGLFGVAKGYELNLQEQCMREIVESLMCNYRLHWTELSAKLGISVNTLKKATAYREEVLNGFVQDGLLVYDEEQLQVTPAGYAFVRNIVASLDPLMIGNTYAFSKPV